MEHNESEVRSSVAILNTLLGAELSAESTYRNILAKAEGEKLASVFYKIHKDHVETRDLLSTKVEELGGIPLQQATTWKGISFLTESSSHPLSDPTAIKALREGEEQAVLTYESTLLDRDIDSNLRNLIETKLLPMAKRHIPVLEAALASQASSIY